MIDFATDQQTIMDDIGEEITLAGQPITVIVFRRPEVVNPYDGREQNGTIVIHCLPDDVEGLGGSLRAIVDGINYDARPAPRSPDGFTVYRLVPTR